MDRDGLSSRRQTSWILFAVLAVLANFLLIYFMRHEKTIYFWDQQLYWNKFEIVADLLKDHFGSAFSKLHSSITQEDYNDLAAWPLAPVALVFGSGRISYLLAILNIFMLPVIFSFTQIASAIKGKIHHDFLF